MADFNENVNTPVSDVQDIDLSAIRKKRFRINKDDNAILELNTTDFGMLSRLEESYKKLGELQRSMNDFSGTLESGDDSDEATFEAGKKFKEVDVKMRQLIDYIFDANVSELCAPFGSMMDPVDGKLRYEYIIDTITALYEDDLKKETQKIRHRMESHTAKYTKK